nr:hypothetical protein BHM03_00062011 [Ipomoea trifida]
MASLFTPSLPDIFHSFDPTPVPVRKISVISFSFTNCSANRGHVTIGTPADTPSRIEFHPQWVTNAPTAGWSRIRTWGAHPLMINPFPLNILVMLCIIRFQLIEAVEDCPIARLLRFPKPSHEFQLGILNFAAFERGNLQFGEFELVRKIGNIKKFQIRCNIVERLVNSKAIHSTQGQVTGPVKYESWDIELGGGVCSPREKHIGDEAIWTELL